MKIDKIIIVGGGSAGWMTAATLIKYFPNKDITLIESPNIPTVGVGESTIFQIREWLRTLEINEEDFMRHTDASYKLSIKFTDFYKKGEAFHYPFGQPNFENNANRFNDWWYKKILKPETPNSDFANCMFPQMAYVNNNTFDKKIQSAYHFDATKFGLWLRDHYCLPKGVKHIKEDVNTIEQDKDGIISLNQKHKADLYIDCTGFKSLLLGETLKEEFEDMSDMLPNNSAWATRIPYKDKQKELVPYTNSTAIENGWVWNIPLWSRIGTGYVYSDKFIDDDNALKQFQKHLGTDELEFKKIKMRVGIHKRLFVKNVVAIGLSAGFIEPLESNGLFSVHEFAYLLVRNIQRDYVSQWDKDNFNFNCKTIFYNFAEFVALHYALSHRTDTEYWKNNFNKNWSKEVTEYFPTIKGGLLEIVGRRSFDYNFSNSGFACISAGFNWGPTDKISLLKYNNKSLDKFEEEWAIVENLLEYKKNEWNNQAKKAPLLYNVLKKYYEETK